MRIGAECFVDRAIAFADRLGAIDVQRRAFGLGDRRKRHTVAHELVIRVKTRMVVMLSYLAAPLKP